MRLKLQFADVQVSGLAQGFSNWVTTRKWVLEPSDVGRKNAMCAKHHYSHDQW